MSQTEVEINDLRKRLLAAEERLATVEENYGRRVDTFIRDTEHLLGRVEKLERQKELRQKLIDLCGEILKAGP